MIFYIENYISDLVKKGFTTVHHFNKYKANIEKNDTFVRYRFTDSDIYKGLTGNININYLDDTKETIKLQPKVDNDFIEFLYKSDKSNKITSFNIKFEINKT